MSQLFKNIIQTFNTKRSKNIVMVVLMLAVLGISVISVGQRQSYLQHAQSVDNPSFYCLGSCPTPTLVQDAVSCTSQSVLDSPEFQQNQETACGKFYGNAVNRVMKASAGTCQTREDAKKVLDEACISSGYTPSHDDTPVPACSCQMVIKSDEFINSRDQACGAFQSTAVDAVYNNLSAECTSQAQAEQAVKEACTGACKVVSPTVNPTFSSSSAVPIISSTSQGSVTPPAPCVTVSPQPPQKERRTGVLGMIQVFLEFILRILGINGNLGRSSTIPVSTPCVPTPPIATPASAIDLPTTASDAATPTSTISATVEPTKTPCSVEMLVTSQQFLDNQEIACGLAKVVAVEQFASNPESKCTSPEQAQVTVDAACKQLGH